MKKIFFIAVIAMTTFGIASAQFLKAELQVAGLTCSMCSRATDKQLRTLDFIDSISVDLASTTFILHFKKDKAVDPEMIKKKVQDAGFSVAMLKLTYHFPQAFEAGTKEFSDHNSVFYFIPVPDKPLSGDVVFMIIDKNFVGSKDFKIYASAISEKKKEEKAPAGSHVFHIKL